MLQARLDDLSAEAGHSKQAEAPRHIFSIEQIKNNDSLVRYYTGFASYPLFLACFNFLLMSAEVM